MGIRMNEEKPKKWQVWLENKKVLNRDFKKYIRKYIIRKIEASPSLSKIHLEKAYHNLDFANFTVQNQENINKRVEDETYSDWVIVISYYAMYRNGEKKRVILEASRLKNI